MKKRKRRKIYRGYDVDVLRTLIDIELKKTKANLKTIKKLKKHLKKPLWKRMLGR